MTGTKWLICIIASIGFAFDIYELLMLPLVVRPALAELVGPSVVPGSQEFQMWVGRLFFIPAFVGGIFGLLGGYLTDRLGRRRVLTWSILLYAFSAFAAGYSTSIWMLLFFRCTTFIGVCVEFVAAVAWLAELFPEKRQREKVLGLTQAFSSVGGLLVAIANGICVAWAAGKVAPIIGSLELPAYQLPAIHLPQWLINLGTPGLEFNTLAPWRYTLMSGLIPAIPLIVIRPFLPESPAWKAKKEAGSLSRPSIGQLFQPQYRRTTIITALMFAFSYGAAFGAIQHMPQFVSVVPEISAEVGAAFKENLATRLEEQMSSERVQGLLAGKSEEEQAAIRAEQERIAKAAISGRVTQEYAHTVTKVQEFGGLTGRVLLAVLVLVIVGQGALLRSFLIPGLVIFPLCFAWAATAGLTQFQIMIFLAGVVTTGQFSFWGNYLPRVYPVHLRGTGESFAANIGGRMIGTSFAWVTATLAAQEFMPGETPAAKLVYTCAIVGTFVFVMNFLLSFLLPQPPEELPE